VSLGARRRPPTPPFVANELWRRAGAVPSFHIAPARTQNARDLITGSVLGTYNSASPAWAVGPDGVLALPAANAPVIEYDPVTLACLGARIWGVVTNLSLHSRDLTQTAWSKSGITATRDQVGADGVGNAATRLTATSSDGTCLQTITSASATRVSGFYIRRITGTGTVEITQDGGATWTAVSLTGTFARYSIASATVTNPQIGFRIRSNGDEIAVDFAQLQSASALGPPVATTTTTASSTADAWSITGADFSRIWNQSAVTFYAEATRGTVPGTEFPVLIDARTTNAFEIVQCSYLLETVAGSLARSNNAIQAEMYPTGLANIRTRRIAAAFAQDDFATCANGGIVLTDSSGIMPSPDRISLGSASGGQPLNGYIREAAIFRSRRPNANLQAMT